MVNLDWVRDWFRKPIQQIVGLDWNATDRRVREIGQLVHQLVEEHQEALRLLRRVRSESRNAPISTLLWSEIDQLLKPIDERSAIRE